MSTAKQETRNHVRGSSLLLAGRLISLILNLVVQVLAVRYLSKEGYGAFAYAMSIMTLGARVAPLGLENSLARYVPLYQERGDTAEMAGTIILALLTIVATSVSGILLLFGLRGWLGGALARDALSVSVLLIVFCLTPFQALENALEKLMAIFARARALFWRRHVLGPSLKLASVLALIIFGGDVFFLASAYVVAGAVGVLVSCAALIRVFRQQRLLQIFKWPSLKFPAREVFRFGVPLMSTDAVFALRMTLGVVLLEVFHGVVAVATFRAVLPVARLNSVVFDSFRLLYLPAASRMFARGDHGGINELYWRSTAWIAVFTLPVVAITLACADPLAVFLFDERYASSGPVLSMLACGMYLSAAFGFNTLTLRVYGKVRLIVWIDVALALAALVASVLLIPTWGAMGAAMASTGVLVVQNLAYQWSLVKTGALTRIPTRYLRIHVLVVAWIALQFALQQVLDLPLYAGLGASLLGTVIVLLASFRGLEIAELFPELARYLPQSRAIESSPDEAPP